MTALSTARKLPETSTLLAKFCRCKVTTSISVNASAISTLAAAAGVALRGTIKRSAVPPTTPSKVIARDTFNQVFISQSFS